MSIEDFSILKVLGTGSYGKVQLVRNKGDTKLYAMKSLKKQELARQRQLVHTQTEYNIAFNHSHRYLVNLVFAFQVMGMVMGMVTVMVMLCDRVFECHVVNLLSRKDSARTRTTNGPVAPPSPSPLQTPQKLYLVLEFCPGGEMFSWLRKANRFSVQRARMYLTEVVSAISFLHR